MSVKSDVQAEVSTEFAQLDWVGMTRIQSAVRVLDQQQNSVLIPSLLDLGVSLAEKNRGIHMSRLYRIHQQKILNQIISKQLLQSAGNECLQSQEGLSQLVSMKLSCEWPMLTQSLKSNLAGYRNYPLQIIFEKNKDGENLWLQYEIIYSSTCPQSASLAVEVFNSSYQRDKIERLPATPHAQRSRAVIRLRLQDISQEIIESLVVQSENFLGTPVQTTVKKEDEMHFAVLNAQNLMFCEDAARKLCLNFKQIDGVLGLEVYCEHQESLHPHNATSLKKFNYFKPLAIDFD